MKLKEFLEIISILFVLIGILLFLFEMIKARKTKNKPKKKEESLSSFAILIPARDESAVIRGLLESIKNQKKPLSMNDVYVIVEKITDLTVMISKEYNVNVIVRKQLDKKRKGYALDEAIKEIQSTKKKYDAYFIFDADNVLDSNYFIEMEKCYLEGYDIAIGYRACKNGNDSIIAASSALTFSMINTIGNKHRMKKNQTMTISGTGFYIKGYLIDKWQGYPFHSLTEDYELTLYTTLHGLTSTYCETAVFYDEQPIDYKTTVNQRTRWIRGYIDARKKYIPLLKNEIKKSHNGNASIWINLIGVWPYLLMVIGIVLLLLTELGNHFFSSSSSFLLLGLILLLVYLVLMVFTLLMIYQEKEKLNLSKKNQMGVIFFNPLFLASYIPCAIRALLNHNLEWKKIEHVHESRKSST